MTERCDCETAERRLPGTYPDSLQKEGEPPTSTPFSSVSASEESSRKLQTDAAGKIADEKNTGTKRIGVILPYPYSFVVQERLRGILTALEENNCELILYSVRDPDEYESLLDLIASDRRVDGLIVLSLLFPQAAALKFLAVGIPVCLVDSEVKGFCSICTDARAIGRSSAVSLFHRGYRKPAFIGEPTLFTSMVPMVEELYRGFKNAWEDMGVGLSPDFVWFGPYDPVEIERAVLRFVSYGNLPDCILIPNDCMALVLIRVLEKKNLRVPGQIAVMSIGNSLVAQSFSLSSIDLRLANSGYLAVKAVLDCLSRSVKPSCCSQPFEIIERGTVAMKVGPSEKRAGWMNTPETILRNCLDAQS